MKTKFAPLLAAKLDFSKLEYPVYVSLKLDGIRAIIRNGKLVSRSLKPIPNKFICSKLEKNIMLEGLDGELVVGEPYGEGVFQRSSSGVMSCDGEPDFKFYVFDYILSPLAKFKYRLAYLQERERCWPSYVILLPQYLVWQEVVLKDYHDQFVGSGAEGTIVRSPSANYKFGRSTTNEGILLKLVNYETEEATIVDFQEQQHNGNLAERDAFGHTKRSTRKSGKTPLGVLGAFIVESEKYRDRFDVGTGFTALQRNQYWVERKGLRGKIIRFKHKDYGVIDKPRHPVFQGFRDKRDI